MKYIETPALAHLASALAHDGPECSVRARVEAYSCKPITRDKRLFRALDQAAAHSPPPPAFAAGEDELAPLGPNGRKTLYLLIATLNVAFPDHEFSDVRPGHFSKEPSGAAVLTALSTTLVSPGRAPTRAPRTYGSYPPSAPGLFPSSTPTSSSPLSYMLPSPSAPPEVVARTHPTLFRLLDGVVGLTDCDVFSYQPDLASDPHATADADDSDDGGSDEDSDSGDEGFPFDANWDDDDGRAFVESPVGSSPPARLPRARGALLWSSHWFFLNRKLKRVVYISLWSRSTRPRWRVDSGSSDEWAASSLPRERFTGWSDGEGAGARAMGLNAWM